MANRFLPLPVTRARRRALERLAASTSSSTATRRRARAVLMMAAGRPGVEVARRCGYTTVQVSRIRRRFVEEGPDGLRERPRPGRPPRAAARAAGRVIALGVHPGAGRDRAVSAREVAQRCGISHDTVIRIWKAHGIRPARGHASKVSMLLSDPLGDRTRVRIIGLRIAPPQSALCLQVLPKERHPAGIRRRAPVARRGAGSPSLVSALGRATSARGSGTAGGKPEDLPKWLKRIRARHPGGEIHVVVESVDPVTMRALRRWLTWRRMVHLHVVPAAASWRAAVRAWLTATARRDPPRRRTLLRVMDLLGRRLGASRGGSIAFQWPAPAQAPHTSAADDGIRGASMSGVGLCIPRSRR